MEVIQDFFIFAVETKIRISRRNNILYHSLGYELCSSVVEHLDDIQRVNGATPFTVPIHSGVEIAGSNAHVRINVFNEQ